MWWCCGKTKKSSHGCKYQKHISKEDYNDEEENTENVNSKIKCQVCNSPGHKAHECDKDPNIRTFYEGSDEIYRVEKIMNNKKKMMDAFTVTK
jgi:hypothetical protein